MSMELIDQVCTLEQAKRLKEVGISQNGFFMWQETGNPDEYAAQECLGIYNPQSYDHIGIAYAYTVAELGEMLPYYLVNIGELTVKKNYRREKLTGWNTRYEKTTNCKGESLPVFCSETQAQSLALMLIYLIENKLVDVATINNKS